MKSMTDTMSVAANSSNTPDSRDGEEGDRSLEFVVADLHNKRYPAPDRYYDHNWMKDVDLSGRTLWFDGAILLGNPSTLDSTTGCRVTFP